MLHLQQIKQVFCNKKIQRSQIKKIKIKTEWTKKGKLEKASMSN